MWDRQIPELTRHWRVVRFDLPGHGGAPAAPAAAVDDLGDRLVATLDSLGVDRFGYVGCSLSAAVGIDIALRHPHRLASLALVAASPRYGTPDSWRQRGETVRREGLDPVARSAPERWFTANFSGAQPAIVDWAVQMVGTTDTYAYVAACDALAAFDVRAELTRISVPTLVIVGAEDTTTPPADARVLVAGIHDAKLAVVPGASHLTPVEQPAAVTDLLVRHFTTAWQLSTQQGLSVLPGASASGQGKGGSRSGPAAPGATPPAGADGPGAAGAGFGADGPGAAGPGATSSGAAAGAGGVAHPAAAGPARGSFGAPGAGFGAPGSGMPGLDFSTPPGGTGGPASGPAPGAGSVSSTTPGSGIPGPVGTPAPGSDSAGFGTPGAASGGGFGAPGSGSAGTGGPAVTGPATGRTGDGFGVFAPGSGAPGAPGPAGPQAFGGPGYGPGAPGPASPGPAPSDSAAPGSGTPGPGSAGGAAFGTAPGGSAGTTGPGAGGSDTVRITPGTGTPDAARIPSGPGVPDTVRITPGPPPASGAHGFGAAGLPAAEPAAAEPGAAGSFGGFGPPPAEMGGGHAGFDALDRGKRIRRDVLGDEAADRAEADRDAFTGDFHDLVARSAWGETWARPGLDRRTRALLTLTALTARGHYDDIAPYTRAALRSGAGPDEIKETLLHAAVYCGLPAAGAAFAVAQRVIAEEAGPGA
nr:alpha/beta fold hydrolase [Streptomyces roseoverticillatus]